MQQSYTNFTTPYRPRNKQFLNMLAGMIYATAFGALWYGLSASHIYVLLAGVGGIVLGLIHLSLEYKKGQRSYHRAAVKQQEENMKQEFMRLAQQSSPARPSYAKPSYQRHPVSHHPYSSRYKQP